MGGLPVPVTTAAGPRSTSSGGAGSGSSSMLWSSGGGGVSGLPRESGGLEPLAARPGARLPRPPALAPRPASPRPVVCRELGIAAARTRGSRAEAVQLSSAVE
ncbi:hypothetical protein PVAP13_9KG176626 [Panicum virgatum]|uniref:Uncharacterized protein n=1 Tax=Panicum virgatum TaxID=38727 RepID=A0A8T0NPR4_PANVG|nr:hypothetical protein PVAP13_9KG176626 [Panicum virgatum]